MIMLLYFSILGGIFYKLFLTSPSNHQTNTTKQSFSSNFDQQEAAGLNVR